MLSSVIQEVVNVCFTPEEIALFEIRVNNRVVSSLANQFLSVYRNRYYPGTKEELINDFILIKEDNILFLHQLENLQKNIKRLLIPQLFADAKYINVDHTHNSSSVSTGKTITETNVDSFDINTVESNNYTSSLNIAQAGSSESNRVDKINNLINTYKTNILPPKRLKIDVNAETKKFTKVEKEMESDEQPQYSLIGDEGQREYQNLTFEQNNTFDSGNSYDISTSASGDKTVGEDSSSNLSSSIGGSKRDSSEININENDARIKIWKLEIRRLREEFIHLFDELFYHVSRH